MDILESCLACLAVLLTVSMFVFVVMPRPFSGRPAVFVADVGVMVVGLAATIVLPPVIMRSGWAAAVVVAAVLVYPFGVVLGGPWIPFLLTWLRCRRRPVMATSFAASFSYWPRALPTVFDDGYVCTPEQAEARGYRRAFDPRSDPPC